MKKNHFFVLSFLFVTFFPCFGLSYTINFTGSGASTSVSDVLVQNLTRGTSVTVPTGNILNLIDGQTAIAQPSANEKNIRVYPNSADGKSTVSFYAKNAGSAQLNIFSIDGKKVTEITTNIQSGTNMFQISLPKGSYAIQVIGHGYSYVAKMINQSAALSRPEIAYYGTEKQVFSVTQKSKGSILSITTMVYNTGDRLLLTGNSGNFSTIISDVPTSDKTINFEFLACTDGDGNNYKIVTIGTQTWMAENLKTSKYNDGTVIPLITSSTTWSGMFGPAYCWFNNDAGTYKNIYGALYNAYASNTPKLAPIGWHIATKDEWVLLNNYISANSSTYGTVVKALAASTYWSTNGNPNVIGNDLTKNNSTGFSALPAGNRLQDGGFASIGNYCSWWSSYMNAYSWILYNDYGTLLSGDNIIQAGMSVRCVKD
jgi:uncharacterized protein (TIGR02145 family)